jgi:hypothetical protein
MRTYNFVKSNQMNVHARITEDDFRANETRRLMEFAGRIRLCRRTPAQIATDCNLDVRTVLRALRAEPLKSDAQARIEY